MSSSSPPGSHLESVEEPAPASVDRLPPELRLLSLQRYAAFFAASPDGLLVVEATGEILYCNQAACTLLARSSAELRAARLEAFLEEDGLARYAEVALGFVRGALPPSADLPFLTGAGARRILNLTFNGALREESGIIVGLRDVTNERALERELTRTKEFLQRVIDSSVDAIVCADMEGNVQLFNPAAERLYGYAAHEVVGTLNVRELYPEGSAREVMRRIRDPEHFAPGELHGYETELLSKGGERIPVTLSAALLMHRERAVGSVGVFTDLRPRRRMEASLTDANRRLAEQEKLSVVAELAGATAHELNQPLTAIAGYATLLAKRGTDDERTARALHNIGSEVDRMSAIVRKIGSITRYETIPYVGETRILDLEASVGRTATSHENDSPAGDLWDLEKLASIGRNVAEVVHEVNNPLTAILSYAEGLSERLRDRLEPRDHERLGRIVEAANRIRRFTRELIDYSKPAARTFTRVDVHHVIERAIELTAHLRRDGDVSLDRAFNGSGVIEARESLLLQVFVNLLTNAAHALAGRGGTIRIGTEATPDTLVIDVADDGPGIAPENLARVFEPYFTTKPREVGSGLGLSIVQEIVHEHGGHIRLHACAPNGARFRIELPVRR